MSISILDDTQEEIDSKRRKMSGEAVRPIAQITNHFTPKPKTSKSPSALKKSTYINSISQEVTEDSNNLVCIGSLMTYLYLIVDMPPDRDYIGRYRIVLGRLFSSIKSADPDAVIILYKSAPEWLDDEIYCSCSLYIDQLNKVPRSIVQLLKYFPKGKPKQEGGIVFTNFLLLHNERVEDMIMDVKNSMEIFNAKIGKQRV